MRLHLHPPFTPSAVLLARRNLVMVLALLFGLLALAAAVGNGELLLTLDEPIQQEVEASRTSLLDDFFLTVSRLGSTVVVLSLGTLTTLLTWRRCAAVSIAVAVAMISRPLLEFTLKVAVDRSRPDFERLADGNGPSFPSGHPMAAMALWGLLPVVVALYTNRRAVWWAAVALASALIIGIGASRVYMGMHWFSDVVAGLIVGAFFLVGIELFFHRTHSQYPCRHCGPVAAAPDGESPGESPKDDPPDAERRGTSVAPLVSN